VIHRLDPRGKVVVAMVFSVLLAVCERWSVLFAGLGLAVMLVALARLPLWLLLKRLAAVNVFVLLVVIILPLTAPGRAAFAVGPAEVSAPGLRLAGLLALRANAIVLLITVMLSTVELVALGHALQHLKVPEKLVHLLLMTVRYVELLRHEYHRLRQAMKVRAFRPGMSLHTYRSIGYLVGMLLVRSFERSDRVLAAMKCRGFTGRFYMIDHFVLRRRDAVFAALAVAALAVMLWMEWA
jgi:cobalt/nickel transport system permease protein